MSWFLRIFFAIIGLCIVIAAIDWLRNHLSRKHTAEVVVKQRKKSTFPVSIVVYQKKNDDCELTFNILKENRDITLPVNEKIFASLPTGTKGILTWQGERFCEFQIEQYPDYMYASTAYNEEENCKEDGIKVPSEDGTVTDAAGKDAVAKATASAAKDLVHEEDAVEQNIAEEDSSIPDEGETE